MFGRKSVKFDGIIHRSYGDNPAYDYYCFSETSEDTGLAIDGPFSDLSSLYRYDVTEKNESERFIEAVTGIADNFRFPTQDPNYGRCRPGCRVSRTVEELNPIHGAAENEIYNIDLCAMVADTAAQKAKILSEDGFAADSPRSYVSGHSAQIWALALSFIQMNNEGNCEQWVRKAFEYSVNRSVGRFHWNSDCVYGRLFGAMTLPIVNAMSGLHDDYEATKAAVQTTPTPPRLALPLCSAKNLGGEEVTFTMTIRNESNRVVSLNGEMSLILANPDKQGNYYGWQGCYNRTGHIRFLDETDVLMPSSQRTFENVSGANSEVTLRGRNPLDPSLLPETGRQSNVLLYDSDGVFETYVPQPISPDIIFEDGTIIEVIIK